MSSVEEPDYVEVYADLQFLMEHGHWKEEIPKWALDWAREQGCFVGSPSILLRGWQFVAERAMKELQGKMRKVYVNPQGDPMNTVRRIEAQIEKNKTEKMR
jgi:hypothetical protein